MSVDPQQAVQRERTDQAFAVKEPAQNPRIGPRVIPVIIALLIGVALIAIIFFMPR